MRFFVLLFSFVLCTTSFCTADENPTTNSHTSDRDALSPLQPFVGVWRGVGQPRRGSNRGAWIEKSQWAWKFDGDKASDARRVLTFDAPQAKYLRSGELKSGAKPNEYRLVAKTAEGKELIYTGARDETGKLILLTNDSQENSPVRISFRLIAGGDRLIVLYERKSSIGDNYLRLAEVGYTRQGSNFGKDVSVVECIVTGGKGVIPVTYNGKTYYVCCTGCRDLFNEDPEGVLAEYAARKKEKAADQKQ